MVGRHFDALVFDLDGTLVDTAPDILAYLNDMLAELGRPGLDQDQIHPLIGDGVKSLLIRGLEASGGVPDALDLDALFDRYLARYTEEPARLSKPFEGVIETLDTLLASNVKMGVCTNKPQAATDRLLFRVRPDHSFRSVVSGDKMAVRKTHP
ncbi:MAG: HAD hydrolase-like protein, partial [Geminicoccaceae bacterium]